MAELMTESTKMNARMAWGQRKLPTERLFSPESGPMESSLRNTLKRSRFNRLVLVANCYLSWRVSLFVLGNDALYFDC
jgi:hypothetical protein